MKVDPAARRNGQKLIRELLTKRDDNKAIRLELPQTFERFGRTSIAGPRQRNLPLQSPLGYRRGSKPLAAPGSSIGLRYYVKNLMPRLPQRLKRRQSKRPGAQ